MTSAFTADGCYQQNTSKDNMILPMAVMVVVVVVAALVVVVLGGWWLVVSGGRWWCPEMAQKHFFSKILF